MKIVECVWTDACSVDKWASLDEIQSASVNKIRSVGFLVKEDKEKIIMVLNIDKENNHYSCSMVIPRKFILSLRTIEDEKEIKRPRSNSRRRQPRG